MEDKDIKILEEFISNYKDIQEKYKDDEIQAEIERSCYFEEVPAKEIEKLLQAYKQDEKIINEMAKKLMVKEIGTDNCGYDEKYSCDKSKKSYRNISCINCIIDYFRKECE